MPIDPLQVRFHLGKNNIAVLLEMTSMLNKFSFILLFSYNFAVDVWVPKLAKNR